MDIRGTYVPDYLREDIENEIAIRQIARVYKDQLTLRYQVCTDSTIEHGKPTIYVATVYPGDLIPVEKVNKELRDRLGIKPISERTKSRHTEPLRPCV